MYVYYKNHDIRQVVSATYQTTNMTPNSIPKLEKPSSLHTIAATPSVHEPSHTNSGL